MNWATGTGGASVVVAMGRDVVVVGGGTVVVVGTVRAVVVDEVGERDRRLVPAPLHAESANASMQKGAIRRTG